MRSPRFDAVYGRSIDDPEGFWGEAARAIDWHVPPERVLDRDARRSRAGSPAPELNTCHNALDRHVDGGRGDQPALIYDSPVTGTQRDLHLRRAARRGRAPGRRAARRSASSAATASSSTCRWCPRRVMAMLACARLGAIHSVVFGGFAAHELAVRIDDARPQVVLSASCGLEGARVVAYKPLLDAALDEAAHAPEHCVILQRPQLAAELTPGRDLDWAELVRRRRARAVRAGARDRPALHPLHLRHDRPPEGRRARQRRPRGRARVEHAQRLRRAPGRGLLGGLRRRLGRRPLLHRLRAAAGRRDDGALRGQARRHARRGRVLARDRAARRGRAVHRADRDPRDPQGGSARPRCSATATLPSLRTLFLAGERTDPDTYDWASRVLGRP